MNAGKQAKDDSAILALACGATVETAAQKAGISKRTLQRRQKDPKFQRQIQVIRGDMVQRLAGTMTAAGTEAMKTMLDLLKGNTPANVRFSAAKALLELGPKYREISDFEGRLATLEQQALESLMIP